MVEQNLNPFSSKKTGFFIEDQLVSIQNENNIHYGSIVDG